MRSAAPRLLVDVQTVQGGFFGNRGIRRYAIGLARALITRGLVRALLLNPGRPWVERMPPELVESGKLAWATSTTLRGLDADGATGYLITSPFERTRPVDSAVPPYVVESGLPLISLLYDLIPEIADVYPPSLMPAYWARRRLVQQADLLLTLSEHVRRDAISRLGMKEEQVVVIGAGASEFFRRELPGDRSATLLRERLPGITRPFVLCVTGWSAHKNAEGLIDAWSQLPARVRHAYQLVLTCTLPPDAGSAWQDQAATLGLAPGDVVVTNFVADDLVRALYQRASLFVLPSREEGFGLPVLEAVRCGCPAITSNASSLPEVLAWEPATFPPDDADAMAARIERGLLDDAFRAALRAVGDAAAHRHTWERVAERTAGALIVRPQSPRRRRVPRPRVALVDARRSSTTTGHVGDGVAERLADRCHIDRFAVSSNGTSDDDRDPAGARFPARAFGRVRDPWGYDVVVYAIDREPPSELLALAAGCPGVVWFVEPPDAAEVVAELVQGARATIGTAASVLSDGPFGRSVPFTVVPSGDDAAVAAALVDLVDALVGDVTGSTR